MRYFSTTANAGNGHSYNLYQNVENNYTGQGRTAKWYYIQQGDYGYLGVACSISDNNNVGYNVRANINCVSRNNDDIQAIWNGTITNKSMDNITEGITDINHIYPDTGIVDNAEWELDDTAENILIVEATKGIKINDIKINDKCTFDGQTIQKSNNEESDFIMKSLENEDLRLNLLTGTETNGGLWVQRFANGNAEIINYPKDNDPNNDGDLLINSRLNNLRFRTAVNRDDPSTGSLDRLTITPNTGNVGIGTSTPTEKLEVNGNIKSNSLMIEGSNNTISSTTGLIFNTTNSNSITLNQGGTERMRINQTTGNVGIGTTVPRKKLDVAGEVYLGLMNGIDSAGAGELFLGRSDATTLHR